MSNSLILLTDSFPYGTSETFLENELPILASSFAHILILPTHAKGIMRPLPENVKVDSLLAGTDVPGFLRTIRQLFSPAFYHELQHIRQRYRLPFTFLTVKQCLRSLARAKFIAQRLHQFVKQEELLTDNLIFYSYWADETAVALAWLKKLLHEIKAITRAHGWDVYFERRNTGFIPFRSLLFQHLDAVFFISQHGLDYTTKRFPEHVSSFHLSRLGTLQGEWVPEPAKPTPIHLVSVSNLIPLKRVNLIIKALGELDVPIRWTHFGDGPERLKLEQRVHEVLDEKANVSWAFKGQVSNTAILAFYRNEQPHLFINVSTTEGLPVSIMEAMAHSIPVIATDVGGTHEIVRDGHNGFLLPADLVAQQLAHQIKAFHEMDANHIHAMRQKAYQTWSLHFNAEINYQRFAEHLLQL